jgi:hypothetical protein
MNVIRILLFMVLSVLVAVPLVAVGQQPPPAQAPVVPVTIYTPDNAVKLAAADLATIPEEERQYIRYISLYNIPKIQRKDYAAIVSFVVNSLSTRRQIYIPVFVGNSDETLIRINIDDYEWKKEAWDNLGAKGSGPKAQPEPYFQTFIEKLVDGEPVVKKVSKQVTKTKKVLKGYYANTGQPYYVDEQVTETVQEEVSTPGTPVRKKILAGAPWVDPEALAFLIKYTGSPTPIFRADWFITYVTIPGAYYEFLKLGNDIKDFERLVFADDVLAAKARSQDKAVVVTSNVARNNRTLNRSPTFTGGYYWKSHDTLSSIDDRQYVLNLLAEKFDATEDIASLPNGLQAYFLSNGKGERQDAAPTDIAIDNSAVDRTVRAGRSCIICHSSGILPLDDEVRSLTKKLLDREQVKLFVTKKDDLYRIQDLFGSNLDEQIIKDQNLYVAAVARTNGLKSDVNAKLYAKIWDSYYEKLMHKAEVAADLGVPLDELERLVRLSNDPVMLGMIRDPIRPIRRDQWERSFQGMMLIVLAQKTGAVPLQKGLLIGPAVPVYTPVK